MFKCFHIVYLRLHIQYPLLSISPELLLHSLQPQLGSPLLWQYLVFSEEWLPDSQYHRWLCQGRWELSRPAKGIYIYDTALNYLSPIGFSVWNNFYNFEEIRLWSVLVIQHCRQPHTGVFPQVVVYDTTPTTSQRVAVTGAKTPWKGTSCHSLRNRYLSIISTRNFPTREHI